MPRIDPVKLLTCISSLLSPNGGIRSTTEVKRLANLMGKYSKKLVSKCIYIQILKCTDTELLGQFMSFGGWSLVYQWLKDGIESKNWSLVQELLELLLLCPVDVPRLQSNPAPKLVKTLSREKSHEGVQILAEKLVDQWLKIARGEITSQNVVNKENLVNRQNQLIVNPVTVNQNGLEECETEINENDVNDSVIDSVIDERENDEGNLVFKITVKDGMHKVDASPKKTKDTNELTKSEKKHKDGKSSPSSSSSSSKTAESRSKDGKDRDRTKDKDRHHKKSSSSSHKSSSSSSSHKSSSSSSSKHSSSSSSSSSNKSHKTSSSSSHKSSSSSRDKDKDRHRSSKSSSSSSLSKDKKDEKDKNKSETTKSQAEKDKDTLAKIQPQPLAKVKIPKKTSDDTEKSTDKTTTENGTQLSTKKKSISIEIRKDSENRPKTAKTYNSQFRNHGLAEEAPPPPSRRDLKKVSSVPSTGLAITSNPVKRSLSPTNITKEAEKKIKLHTTSPIVERPGAVKLIPAKPKPPVLIESDMFMDAMTAATTKKEPRKRKRIPSAKECESNGEAQKDGKDSKSTVSAAPLRFYKDTLEESENKDDASSKADTSENNVEDVEKRAKTEIDEDQNGDDKSTESPDEPEEEQKRPPGPGCGPDGPPGVLTIHRRKGPKKSLRWKPQESLEEVRFFELDENERINVTKTFVDMKQMERVSEREAFLISRKIDSEDTMMEQMEWQPLILVDDVPDLPNGTNSKEKEIQAEREKSTLQAIYFSRSSIPDSPHEPDVIAIPNIDPPVIPLEDITGNPDAVHDFTSMAWPEPKGSPPSSQTGNNFDDLTGLSAFGGFNQFGNNMTNWPPNQNPMIGLRPPTQIGFGNILAPDTVNLNMNPLQQFNAANIGNLTPIMQQQLGYLGNFAQAPPIINNDSGRNNNNNNIQNRGGNWFGTNSNNAGNNNWQQQGNNNNNQRQNWMKNRQICTAFQRGNCRRGNKCKYAHINSNGPPKF